MKKKLIKIFLFIGLKIIELSAIIFIPYYLGCLCKLIPIFKNMPLNLTFFKWLFGNLVLGFCFAAICFISMIINWFKFNWNLIDEWINK